MIASEQALSRVFGGDGIRRVARYRCIGSRRTHVLFEQRSSKHRFPVEVTTLLEDL